MTWKALPDWVLSDAHIMRERDLTLVPYFDAAGQLRNRRVFAAGGRCWWEHTGRDLIPFGLEQLVRPRIPRRALFVCEGESDALALRAVASWAVDVVGLPGATSWRPEWRAYIGAWNTIYVAGDGDRAGRLMNARVKHDVPWARPVWLPAGADVRSLVQSGGFDALDPYLADADWYARAAAALVLARNADEFDRLMAGEDVDVGWEPRLAA